MSFKLVTYDIAKDLKRLGYEEKVRYGYHSDTKEFFDNKIGFNINCEYWGISAPDIFQVKRWLLDNHSLHIETIWDKDSDPNWTYNLYFIGSKYNGDNYPPRTFESEDAAIIDAIIVSVKNLKKNFGN